MKVDYLIKNGHVVDGLQNVDRVMDIAVKGNKIVKLNGEPIDASHIIDASGCYVFPGLIDFHTHIFYQGSGIAIKADFMLPCGTTAAVDAGTVGSANFEAFYQNVVIPSTVRIKSFMTVFAGGQLDPYVVENFDPALFNLARIRKMKEKYSDNIIGLKIRLSRGVVPDGEPGLDYLKATVDLAEHIGGLSVCVHTTNPVVPVERIVSVLRPGDIYCHCYQGAGNTIIDPEGKIYEGIHEARKRGVIFDAANGKGNFGLKTAIAALKNGFLPDIISSDLTCDKFNMPPYAKNLPTVMSKYLTLGLDMMTVLKMVTQNPAKLMNMEGKIGTLKPQAYADLCIIKRIEKKVTHKDFCEEELQGNVLLVPQLVMSDGEIQFCQTDFYI